MCCEAALKTDRLPSTIRASSQHVVRHQRAVLQHGNDADMLLGHADGDMYGVKRKHTATG